MGTPILSFDEIRPYRDPEVPAVLHAITQRPSFALLMGYLYPDTPTEELAQHLRQVKAVQEFQAKYIRKAMRNIARDSIAKLTQTGLDQLAPQVSYLFLSNHRDIILDSGLLNLLRHELGYDTTQIAIGDNLMITPMVTDLMKLNKSFVVHRHPPRQHAFAYSLRLSRYIRNLIEANQSSVWLAQRNGRTKDGRDQTQAALLKMLSLSDPDHWIASLQRLRIVPLAISYEYEPCDHLKAEESLAQAQGRPYHKDDKLAIIRGIREPKGRVHVAAGQPLHQELETLVGITNRNDFMRELGLLIDEHISRLYRRWPIQYAAYDLLHGGQVMRDHYQPADRAAMEAHVARRVAASQADDRQALRQMLYRIYAGMIGA
jgi:hypothetical protein